MEIERFNILKTLIKYNFKFGVKYIISGFGYERVHEVPEVIHNLDCCNNVGFKVLDVASGATIYASFLASKGHQVYVVDLNTKDIKWQQETAIKFGSDIKASVQDCSNLTYEGDFFDRIYSISSIEHFIGDNNDGDITAMKQIGRMLKLGGIAVISVPFATHYKEHLDTKNYIGNFERNYDVDNLKKRLVDPSGLTLKSMVLIGERSYAFSNSMFLKFYFKYVPGIIRMFFNSLFILPSLLFIDQIKESDVKPDRIYTAVITLIKN